MAGIPWMSKTVQPQSIPVAATANEATTLIWPPPKVYRNPPPWMTKFETARRSLGHGTSYVPWEAADARWFYEPVAIDEVIEKLGWWTPIHGGRPTEYAQKLLEGIPSPVSGRGMNWKSAGLMYFTPPIVGRSKSRNRTSMPGLALLKHWAATKPKFRPFFEAYYSKDAETRITLDCIDLALGILPKSFRETLVRNEAEERRKAAATRAATYQAVQQYNPGSLSQIGNPSNQLNQLQQSQQNQYHQLAIQAEYQAHVQRLLQGQQQSLLAPPKPNSGLLGSLLGPPKLNSNLLGSSPLWKEWT